MDGRRGKVSDAMQKPGKPDNEAQRLAALRSYNVLDSVCEISFDNIVHLTAHLFDCPTSGIGLIDADRKWLKARVGFDVTEIPRDLAFCSHTICNPTEPLVVPDATCDARFADNPLVTDGGVRFYAGVALVNPEGAALGTLCISDRKPRALSADQVAMLQRLAETVMTTLELRRAMIRVRDFAMHDALTGIANRPACMDALETAMETQRRQGTPFILITLDLDGFKSVNDGYGHAAGDDVLKEVAATLSGTVRIGATAARLGGDEFAVVMAGTEAEAHPAAERLRRAIEERMLVLGHRVTASVGALSFTTPPASVNEALSRADVLMYAAKKSGRNRVATEVRPARAA
jgi:diguanylate cyclase (GGDEF)-like protein